MASKTKDTLASRIRSMREALGITQRETAERMGVAVSYYADMESGRRDNPSLAMLRSLAKALKTTVGELAD